MPCAAVAEDAGPGRGEPGQVAAEALVGIGGVGELDPRAADVQGSLGHGPSLGAATVSAPRPVRRCGVGRPQRCRPRHVLATLDPCDSVSSTWDPTPCTCSWSTPTSAATRCRRRRTRSSCGCPSTCEPDGRIDPSGADALVKFTQECLMVAEDQGVEDLLAFATSAIREAPNGDEVLGAGPGRDGVDLQVLSRRGRVAADLPGGPPLVRLVQRPAAGDRHRRRVAGAGRRAGRGARRRAQPAARRRTAHPRPRCAGRTRRTRREVRAVRKQVRADIARVLRDVDQGRCPRPRRRHEQDAAVAGPDRRRRAQLRGPLRRPVPRAGATSPTWSAGSRR